VSIPIGETPEALAEIERLVASILSHALLAYLIFSLLEGRRRGRRS